MTTKASASLFRIWSLELEADRLIQRAAASHGVERTELLEEALHVHAAQIALMEGK